MGEILKGGTTMDPVMLARIQFALTTIYHFFFVPLTIGLAFIIALMQTLYVVKKKRFIKKWQNSGDICS